MARWASCSVRGESVIGSLSGTWQRDCFHRGRWNETGLGQSMITHSGLTRAGAKVGKPGTPRSRAQLVVGDVFRSAARATPLRIAAAIGDEGLTFAQIDAQSNRLARALRRRGIGRGSHVAQWSPTRLESVVLFAALAKLGAVFVPLNGQWQTAEVEPLVACLPSVTLVVDPARLQACAPLGASVEATIVTFDELGELAASETPEDMSLEVLENDTHVVFFTSGSSGSPKGAVLSHRASVLRSLPGALLEPRGAMVCPYPLFHMGAWTIALQQWQARDAVVFVHTASAPEIIDAVERYQATRLNCVPAVWTRILEHGGEPRDTRLSSIRFADTGTSATPPELLSAMAARMPRAQVRVFYGSTEAGGVSILEHADIARKPGSCGVPGPLTAVRVDEEGLLWVRGPLLFDGYLGDPGATAAAVVDGWYDTGDLAEVDEDGYLTIVGRARDVIRSGGETVAPSEVESVLRTIAGVVDVAVVGVADAQWGEVVCAVVVVGPGRPAPTLDDLRAACHGRIASYKHPRRLAVVDAIPRTASTGQVQRRLVVEMVT